MMTLLGSSNIFSNPLTEYSPQMEFTATPSRDALSESGSSALDEVQEMEFASRLLEATTDEQIERAVEDATRGVASANGVELTPADARATAAVLKDAIHRVLPLANKESGLRPGAIGARLGQSLSSNAEHLLGLELEGLSHEDREFEAVRQFLRFLGHTVINVVEDTSGRSAFERAREAAKEAAQRHAPGLFGDPIHIHGAKGRWIACRDRIILFGI